MDIVQRILNFLDGWKRLVAGMENVLVDNVAATVPWLVPLIPAYMAFMHVTEKFGWPNEMAWIVAIVIEGVGLSAVTTAYQLWDYNQTHKEDAELAQFGIAVSTAAYYLVIVITVNVLLDVFKDDTNVRILAQALLSTLSVVAMVILALRAQHARKLADIQRVKDEAKGERDELEAAEAARQRAMTEAAQAEKKDKAQRRHELKLAKLQAGPQANPQKVSEGGVQVAASDNGASDTYGKWQRWPDVPDVYKRQVAETVLQAKAMNATTYKKIAATYIMNHFGVSERVAYTWIQYAERDFPAMDPEPTEEVYQ